MSPSPLARRAVAGVAVALTCASTVLVAAAPSSAAPKDARTRYAFDIAFTGSVVGGITTDAADASPNGVLDQHDATSPDAAYATRYVSSETLTVQVQRGGAPEPETMTCSLGGENYGAGLQLNGGATTNWVRLPVDGTARARLRVSCTSGGVVHHLNWAWSKSGFSWTAGPTPDCLTLTRTTPTVFTLVSDGCSVQDAVMPTKPGKVLSSTEVRADFTATLTLGAALS